MKGTLMPLWVLAAHAGVEILLITAVLMPERVLSTWLGGLKKLPIVGQPAGLRIVAAVLLVLFTFALVVNIRALLHAQAADH
jgi:hypothetical protein